VDGRRLELGEVRDLGRRRLLQHVFLDREEQDRIVHHHDREIRLRLVRHHLLEVHERLRPFEDDLAVVLLLEHRDDGRVHEGLVARRAADDDLLRLGTLAGNPTVATAAVPARKCRRLRWASRMSSS
jgi:hypothetical protein